MKSTLKENLTKARKAGRIPVTPEVPDLPPGFASRVGVLHRDHEKGRFIFHLRNTAVTGFAVAAICALVVFHQHQPASIVADLPDSQELEWFDMPMLTPSKQ